MTAAPFSALLLAGGRSVRMGTDKALLIHPVSGLPLLQHQAALLRTLPGCAELLLSAPAAHSYPLTGALQYARLVSDAIPDAGPIAGIAAGLAAARQRRLLVLAVDLPAVAPALLRALLAASTDTCGIVPRHSGHDIAFEPLCAVYPISPASSDAFAAALALRTSSLQRLLTSACNSGWMNPLPIPSELGPSFKNWNSPSDLSG